MRRSIIISVLVVLAIAAFWLLSPSELAIQTTAERQFKADCTVEQARRILVRKNVLPEIVALSDLQVLDQQIVHLDGDLKLPDKPVQSALRNVLKRVLKQEDEIQKEDRAHFEFQVEMLLTVKARSGDLEGETIQLRQSAELTPTALDVTTNLEAPAGILQDYSGTLVLIDAEGVARFESKVALDVKLNLPRLFHGIAKQRVQEAAVKAIEDQMHVIQSKVSAFQDELLILPTIDFSDFR